MADDPGAPRGAVGVGGMVLNGRGEVLLVRGTFGPQRGKWHFPGGKVEPGELPHRAAVREVREEAGIDAEVVSLAAVRYRTTLGVSLTPVYLIFFMRARENEQLPCADEQECDAARYFSRAELADLRELLPITRLVALRHLDGGGLEETELPDHSGERYVLFT